MKKYDHKKIEKKWQAAWKKKAIYKTRDGSKKPKKFVLDMFPYPSGEGLHVGHPKGYIATDVYSRHSRMRGMEVLHPMGWDAFGLPAENYAIKNKIHPKKAVDKNIATFKSQLANLGFDYDWSREINTTDPNYYKWTQWIFLKLYEHGLAFQSNEPINWCPSCMTGLANEDLDGNVCERCGTVVEKKALPQWVLKITAYADRMLTDLDTLQWPEHIKEQQRNWIGKSVGAEIDFPLFFDNLALNDNRGPNGEKAQLTVFTTRPDTLYGATFLILSPEHPWVQLAIRDDHKDVLKNQTEVKKYVAKAAEKTDIERIAEGKEKTGVVIDGVWAINPATGEKIPMYVADYVLAGYGTGAIMAVPAHDERDGAFAKKFNLPVKAVIEAYFDKSPDSPMKPELPLHKRDAVCAIVHNPRMDTYLTIEWKDVHMHGIVTGGIEDGEHVVESARREVQEETGYKNLRLKFKPEFVLHSIFFHRMKKINRHARFQYVFFELENDERDEVGNDEKFNIVVWKNRKELHNYFTVVEADYILHFIDNPNYVYTGSGVLANSEEFDGTDTETAKKKITEKFGRAKTTYKLRDWVFSRQRYWGEPIPMIHCATCGTVPVPYKDLPVKLPDVKNYQPTGTGESPLAAIDKWVNVKCPKCKGKAKRETNTMPQWAGSSWYYLRFMDPKNKKALVDPKKEKYWAPVDVYVGGDHAVRHLIYARFWHKFLYDIKSVSTIEPFARLEFLGFILAEDGRKMSKRYGNVINPNDIVKTYGADTMRVYEMFMGPFTDTIAWNTSNMIGARRFLERVWRLQEHTTKIQNTSLEKLLHRTIKKVSDDIEGFKFNTAISSMMIFINAAEKDGITKKQLSTFLQLLAPFAPHITDELYSALGNKKSIHLSAWPEYDAAHMQDDTVTIVIQVNGKMRGQFSAALGITENDARAEGEKAIATWLENKRVSKVIYVPNRLLNFVVAEN